MNEGRSLHIGASVHASFPALRSAARDARALESAARAHGFATELLLDPSVFATEAVLEGMAAATGEGDTLLITFSGHGRDGAWCLRDGTMRFAAPSRGYVCVLSDACGGLTLVPTGASVMAIVAASDIALDAEGDYELSLFTAALLRLARTTMPFSLFIRRLQREIASRTRTFGAYVPRLLTSGPPSDCFERAGPLRIVRPE